MNGKIVIIDGNSLINRAYYAVSRPMITKEGIYTQGIYGFLNMLQKIRNDYEPDHLTVAFDLKAPTFRHIEYSEYKAGRKKMPPELAMQIPLLKDVLRAMKIEILEMEGYEADDIIGTVARVSEEAGLTPLIITGDKDALQLVTDVTKVIITKKGITEFEIYDPDKMLERYGLTPKQFIDLKGLMGDSSDNIPGIPGVGEKTGIKLLEQFGSIENLIANTSEIAADKLRTKVEDNVQLAVMSKRLATINTCVPIDIDLSKLKLKDPNYSKLIEIYTKLEFNSLLKKLDIKDDEESLATEISAIPVEIIENTNDLCKIEDFCDSHHVFLKVIGDGNHIAAPFIEGIVMMSENKGYYLDCQSMKINNIIDKLNNIRINYIGHQLKDSLYSLIYYGLSNINIVFDTAIAEYILDPSKNKYDLDTILLEKMQFKVEPENEFIVQQGQMDLFSDNRVKLCQYYSILGSAVFALSELEKVQLTSNNLDKVYYDVEIPLIEILASMEVSGVKANAEFIDDFGKELKEKISSLELIIYDFAGKKFNINSPMQLGNVLFEDLQLPFGKKTKRGYSTNAEVLEKIRDKHPIVNAVLEYRNISKLNSTYVEGMKPLIGKDGKIRAHFQQTVTTTGRLSCTEPNLQNIPIRQELGRTLRKAFVCDSDDYILIGADYSQIELRVLAHLSGDEELINAFNRGDDIHKITASRVLGVPFDQVTPLERSRAKAVNFGVIYGMSSFGLSEELNITRKEAESYINDYFNKHSKVKDYMDNQISQCRERGYSETLLGRKRYIHEITASNYMVRQLGERLAMNTPIQGSAADIIKMAMIKVYYKFKNDHPDCKILLQVHDELIVQAPCYKEDIIKKELVKCMEDAVSLKVKLVAEVNEGASWYDLK